MFLKFFCLLILLVVVEQLADGLSFYLCIMGCHLFSDMVYKYHLLNQRCYQESFLEFLGKLDSTQKETYGFNSCKCPPIVDELSDFENELMLLVKNIEFINVNKNFLKNSNDDIKRINTTEKVLVKADKSRNIYQLDKNDYKKYLGENITKAYKKSTNKVKCCE